jgi:hypothetical protein
LPLMILSSLDHQHSTFNISTPLDFTRRKRQSLVIKLY